MALYKIKYYEGIVLRVMHGECSFDLEKIAVNDAWSNSAHKCSDCAFSSVSKCKKVYDEVKEPIYMYPFITDGHQTFNSKGNVENFFVEKCLKYQKQLIAPIPTKYM